MEPSTGTVAGMTIEPLTDLPDLSADAPPRLRMSGPDDLLEALPWMLGHHPSGCLVLVGLAPPRSRVSFTARFDLLGDGTSRPPSPREVAADLRRLPGDLGGAQEFVLVVYDDTPAPGLVRGGRRGAALPRRREVRAAQAALEQRGLDCQDLLLVHQGRWWSYRCRVASCCPAEGTPLVHDASSAIALTCAVGGGLAAPAADRAALVASVAPESTAEQAEAVRQAARGLDLLPSPWRVSRLRTALRAALEQVRSGAQVPAEAAAELIALVQHVHARDAAFLDMGRADLTCAVLLWTRLLREAPAGTVAQVGSVLGGLASAAGQSVIARAALERALQEDPRHVLAGLQMQVLAAGLRMPTGPLSTREQGACSTDLGLLVGGGGLPASAASAG